MHRSPKKMSRENGTSIRGARQWPLYQSSDKVREWLKYWCDGRAISFVGNVKDQLNDISTNNDTSIWFLTFVIKLGNNSTKDSIPYFQQLAQFTANACTANRIQFAKSPATKAIHIVNEIVMTRTKPTQNLNHSTKNT